MWSRILLGGKTIKMYTEIKKEDNPKAFQKCIRAFVRFSCMGRKFRNNEYKIRLLNPLRKRYYERYKKMANNTPLKYLYIIRDIFS